MNVTRVSSSEIAAFKTFDGYRVPEFLDIQSRSSGTELLADLPQSGLAIVGTRHPQRRSFDLLEKTLSELKLSGLVIISGFARGIDARAHELAIEHGLKTLAILGCGIDIQYPREHRVLRNRILESGGMILSACDRGSPPFPHHFHQRNGLIAGFSKATWVVEAAAVSGTLNTATWAQKFNRDLYATPCFPGDPYFEGNEKILSRTQTDRFPLAEAFYGASSLGPTWPNLIPDASGQTALELQITPQSDLLRWIQELNSEFGICRPEPLLDLAHSRGMSPGQFYALLNLEIREGRAVQNPDGSIALKSPIRPLPPP